MRWPKGLEGLCYGGDYNPEQWPEKVWEEDVALMRQAGVNLVSVGVFSWARLEPAEGVHDFGWLDRVLDLLHEGGVRVNLATPTASPPPWFSLAHPDALAVAADGTRLTHGSRDTYCVAAPPYREASVRIARALAERYAGHPALAMWHVHNEYGTRCHCDHAAAAFRTWLRGRHGTLEALNDAWTTAFWSQHYSAWEQVMPPRATQYLPNPAQVLDFRRFLSDEMLAHFREQKAVLRELTPDVPVTTNFVFGDWVPVNQWDWAKEVDLVAIDHYPAENPPEETAFAADLARGWAGGRPWLLMEQAVVTYTGPRMAAKRPGEIARLSLSHIARGSRGAMFFQWRASRGGSELWHGGMVPHAGPDSRIFREIRDLGGLLPALAEACEAPVEATAAILWDPEAGWALQAPGLPSTEIGYLEAVRQAHRVLYRHGVTADFVHPSADLSAYELVIVPSLYLISDDAADGLRRYAETGGTLLVSFLSGVADEHARIRLGGYPGALRDLLGVRVEEFHPIGSPVTLDTGESASVWTEHVHLAGARALARYPDGTPAITRSGRVTYLSTRLSDEAYARLLGLGPVAPVELVRRGEWLFAVNHGDREREIPGNLLLPPGGYAVAKVPPA
ncbi:beta-galactosidase [Planomonospora venezuelensis]|uniref:Beta-galactosidase n=1 Tax=Planomonospora venezuelensis TaxID=1999 RepID=A0A841D1N6_PLAVE|nr:beta-galactosidase [Planomonospora venezuelensis]GIN01003.1 beta-galactosidase [Planomonospora venezuelensis]